MATITTTISPIPDAGHRGIDARTEFVNKQEAFQDALTDVFVSQINSFGTEANLVRSEVNSLRDATATDKNTATTQAGIATNKASEANTSANQALTYKNQVMGYVVPSGASYSVEQINTQNSAMTKAQFNALADERKVQRAGSGWDEMGKHSVGYSSVNNGIICSSAIDYINAFQLGWNFTSQLAGDSKTNYPLANVNGVLHKLFSINRSTTSYEINKILLPTAPNIYPYDTVLTAEQIASGVIKHADASNSGLIVNGKFDTDTSGWTALNSSLVVESNKLKITNTMASNGIAMQTFPSIIGKEYIVEFEATAGSHNLGMQIKGNASGITGWSVEGATTGRYTFKYTATTTTTYLLFAVYNNSLGAYAYADNIAVYPADAISRSDLVFLESWHEDVSEKNFVYPLGNVQYLGANTDGLTGITNGNFTGFETYSLFGNFQAPSALIGKGYVWSSLTEAQKRAFIANPENNCYLDGDKIIQVRYRVRVVMGEDSNSMARATVQGKAVVPSIVIFTAPNTTVDVGLYSNTSTTYTYTGTSTNAISIANISRRNLGMYHSVYNPNGTKKASDGNFWYNTAVSFTSISDCFDSAKLLTASGYIGTVSGRPDGLFYDQVHESDITDLRNSSKKVEDYNRLISREFNKLVAGITRGKEGEPFTESKLQTTIGTVATVEVNDGTAYASGSVVQIFDLTAGSVKGRFTVKSVSGNTITVDSSFAKSANIYVIGGGKR